MKNWFFLSIAFFAVLSFKAFAQPPCPAKLATIRVGATQLNHAEQSALDTNWDFITNFNVNVGDVIYFYVHLTAKPLSQARGEAVFEDEEVFRDFIDSAKGLQLDGRSVVIDRSHTEDCCQIKIYPVKVTDVSKATSTFLDMKIKEELEPLKQMIWGISYKKPFQTVPFISSQRERLWIELKLSDEDREDKTDFFEDLKRFLIQQGFRMPTQRLHTPHRRPEDAESYQFTLVRDHLDVQKIAKPEGVTLTELDPDLNKHEISRWRVNFEETVLQDRLQEYEQFLTDAQDLGWVLEGRTDDTFYITDSPVRSVQHFSIAPGTEVTFRRAHKDIPFIYVPLTPETLRDTALMTPSSFMDSAYAQMLFVVDIDNLTEVVKVLRIADNFGTHVVEKYIKKIFPTADTSNIEIRKEP